MARILIAKDGSANREPMSTMLTAIGHHVKGVDTGKEAIVQMDICFPDLIICDLEMRNGDGLDLIACARAKQTASPTPILLLTETDADASLRHRILEKGLNLDDITAIFRKPINLGILRSSVRALLEAVRKAKHFGRLSAKARA